MHGFGAQEINIEKYPLILSGWKRGVGLVPCAVGSLLYLYENHMTHENVKTFARNRSPRHMLLVPAECYLAVCGF